MFATMINYVRRDKKPASSKSHILLEDCQSLKLNFVHVQPKTFKISNTVVKPYLTSCPLTDEDS